MSQQGIDKTQLVWDRMKKTRSSCLRVKTITRRKYTSAAESRIVLEGFRRQNWLTPTTHSSLLWFIYRRNRR